MKLSLISDPALNELDTVGAARVLAAAIQKIGERGYGRVRTSDARQRVAGITSAQTARVLGWRNAWVGWADQSPGWKRDVEQSHRRGQAKRQRKIARRRERRPKHWRAALPIVHGHPQSGEGKHPRVVVERPWHRSARHGHQTHRIVNPPGRETAVEIITGDTPEAIAETLVEKILAEKVL